MWSKKAGSHSWSLAARLTAWYTVAFLAFALFTAGALYWRLAANLTLDENVILADKVHHLRVILRDRPHAVFALRREVELESAARREFAKLYSRLVDDHGRTHLATPGMDALLPPAMFTRVVPAGLDPGAGTAIRSRQNGPFRALAAEAVVGDNGGARWVVQVAVDRGHHELILANFRERMVATLGVAILACPLVAYRIARRGLRPLYQISETARHIGSATLAARIDAAGYPVELGALADTFNGMLDRLEESFRRLSQFSADIAHELRTPIHNMRGEAEVVLSRARSAEEYEDALASCLEESVRLSAIIERLLFLARTESPGTHLEKEEVHVARELSAVRDYYAAAAAEAKVTLSVAAADDVVSVLDRGLLQRAVANLVSNSLSHTAPGGAITLAAGLDEGRLRIEVADTGTGIPAEDLPRVFDRFYRADRSRSSRFGSMGLGLAIVKGIVTLHGGHTEIESEVGKGTRIALIVPSGIRLRDGAPDATPRQGVSKSI